MIHQLPQSAPAVNESLKAVLGVILIFAIIIAGLSWTVDQPDVREWNLRIGSLVVIGLALSFYLALALRRDRAPDYLRRIVGTAFTKDGFAFAFSLVSAKGVAYLQIDYQNQFSQPCRAEIALQPGSSFTAGRSALRTIRCEIHCPPGGFGEARVPIPIPLKHQGHKREFRVGATIHRPRGMGRQLRFFYGLSVNLDANFHDSVGTALTVAALCGGAFFFRTPSTASFQLPTGVTETLPVDRDVEITTLWQCGDPPLED